MTPVEIAVIAVSIANGVLTLARPIAGVHARLNVLEERIAALALSINDLRSMLRDP